MAGKKRFREKQRRARRALGAGALYRYSRNKTDLVARRYRRAFALYERFADAADREGQRDWRKR